MTIGLFWTLFAGFIVGMLMNSFIPLGLLAGTKGLALAVAIGIAGALVASFVGQGLNWWNQEELGAFVSALVGAGALLFAGRFVMPQIQAAEAPPAPGV